MNERILELANEANKDIGYTFKLEDANQLHELMEKFAELIVAECAAYIDDNIGYDDCNNTYPVTGDVLKDHFGVKE